jgi:hypothetical protein
VNESFHYQNEMQNAGGANFVSISKQVYQEAKFCLEIEIKHNFRIKFHFDIETKSNFNITFCFDIENKQNLNMTIRFDHEWAS